MPKKTNRVSLTRRQIAAAFTKWNEIHRQNPSAHMSELESHYNYSCSKLAAMQTGYMFNMYSQSKH